MKVTIKGKQYTLICFINEVTKSWLGFKLKTNTVIYVYDRERKPFKFLAEEIERYD